MDNRDFDLTLDTDAYHMTMGRLMDDPMESESYVLYARRGGPQVVSDLSLLMQRILAAKPAPSAVQGSSAFWRDQGIPFAEEAWRRIAAEERLPIQVRGVRDGEVVLPGDPIAVLSGPAVIVGVLEPILEAAQMTSMQVGTRFMKAVTALGGDAGRLFEVGLRAATSPYDHLEKLAVMKRLGLTYTSNGRGARALGLKAVGTTGHRYMQRFTGPDADYRGFTQAVTRMLEFRERERIEGVVPLSFLLDTRDTLNKGLPAALRVMGERAAEVIGKLALSVRLDSGDLRAQFRAVANAFLAFDKEWPGLRPKIIVESGLTAETVAEFESLTRELDFPNTRVLYGIGGFLVGGISRDDIALVMKLTEFGSNPGDLAGRIATMKFGDEPGAGKESYPGVYDLWEGPRGDRMIALLHETAEMEACGYRNLFIPIVVDGLLQPRAFRSDDEVRQYAYERWQAVTGGLVKEIASDAGYLRGGLVYKRPVFSGGVQALVERLRAAQFTGEAAT